MESVPSSNTVYANESSAAARADAGIIGSTIAITSSIAMNLLNLLIKTS